MVECDAMTHRSTPKRARRFPGGKFAAVTSDDSILLGFEAQDPDTKIVGRRFANEPYGMAIGKAHPDFVRFVNGVLASVRAERRAEPGRIMRSIGSSG